MTHSHKDQATGLDLKFRITFVGAEMPSDASGPEGARHGAGPASRPLGDGGDGASASVFCRPDGSFLLRVAGFSGKGHFWGIYHVGNDVSPAAQHPFGALESGWSSAWSQQRYDEDSEALSLFTLVVVPAGTLGAGQGVNLAIWVFPDQAAQVAFSESCLAVSSSSGSSGSSASSAPSSSSSASPSSSSNSSSSSQSGSSQSST